MRSRAHIRRIPIAGAALAALAVAAFAGCGDSAKGGATARLLITADFGATQVAKPKSTPVTAGLTAMRQLQGNAETDTSYGGRFISSIAGRDGGGGEDWLFYVDGEELDEGAATVRLEPGQVVQWDFHRWQAVVTGKQIVGAFPRPLESRGVALTCVPAGAAACRTTEARLAAAGIAQHADGVPLVVGAWKDVRGEPGLERLEQPAVGNGSYVNFDRGGGTVTAIDSHGKPRPPVRGAGVIAAVGDTDVVWVVTGTDDQSVERAAQALTAKALAAKFALLVTGDGLTSLPLAGGSD